MLLNPHPVDQRPFMALQPTCTFSRGKSVRFGCGSCDCEVDDVTECLPLVVHCCDLGLMPETKTKPDESPSIYSFLAEILSKNIFHWSKTSFLVFVCATCNNKDTRGSKRGHCEAFQCVRAKEKMSVKVAKEEKNGNSRRESFSRRHTRKQRKEFNASQAAPGSTAL